MTDLIADLWKTLRHQLALSPALTGVGLLGVVLGALCLGGAMVGGDIVPPEGSLIETATFNGSLGIFVLTLAVLVPGVGWTRRGRRHWAGLMVGAMVYAYGIETVQAMRGLDPRFSRVAGPVDQALGGVFLLDAIFIMGLFTLLAVKYFRAPSAPLVIAVRYGTLACYTAFGVGILMSAINGRYVGDEGNLLVLHAAGFHGLQAVPLVALLFQWGNADRSTRRPLVHLAGLSWCGGCLAIGWQSGSGAAVMEISAATVVTGICLLTFAVTRSCSRRRGSAILTRSLAVKMVPIVVSTRRGPMSTCPRPWTVPLSPHGPPVSVRGVPARRSESVCFSASSALSPPTRLR